MDYQVDFLELMSHDKAPTHVKVISKAQIEEFIWVHISPLMAPTVTLTKVDQVLPADNAGPVDDAVETIVRDDQKPWLKIPVTLLDTVAGYHLYKFTFHDSVTDATQGVYLAYMIQDDSPVRPYYYMDEPVIDDGSQESVGPDEPTLD